MTRAVQHINLNHVKSFVGKRVNLRLKDGSTLVNVALEGIENHLLLVHAAKPRARVKFVSLFEFDEVFAVPFGVLLQSQEAS